MGALTSAELPVIDFALLSGDQQQQQQSREKLSQAAREVGFFYLINHGIDRALSDEVQQVARQFFALPQADKSAVRMATAVFLMIGRAFIANLRQRSDSAAVL